MPHRYGGVRTADGETYVEYEGGEKAYYDLATDPWQVDSLAAVQRGVVGFTSFWQRGNVDRRKQAAEAQRAFFELVNYYRANEVWLEPETCKKVETFMNNVYLPLGDYIDDLDERGYPQTPEGRAQGNGIMRETQPLRRELIDEFRAILYPPPLYDAPLRFLRRTPVRNRKADEDASGGDSAPTAPNQHPPG